MTEQGDPGPAAVALKAESSDVTEVEYEVARFELMDDTRLVFSYEPETDELGFTQSGRLGAATPLLSSPGFVSIADIYLQISDSQLPVPEELLEEASEDAALQERLSKREISAEPVMAERLSEGFQTRLESAATQKCNSTWFDWFFWHDMAEPGLAPRTYGSSQFGGKFRYAQSYLANCTPSGLGNWLWARHRIYYKGTGGKYRKQYEGKVAPGSYEVVTRGSVAKRYRRIVYDDAWNSSPSNSSLKYTREGRFDDKK